MMVSTPFIVASSLVQGTVTIPMALPRPMAYEVVTSFMCKDDKYVVNISNIGFRSKLVAATMNNRPVNFVSKSGDLRSSLEEMHSVKVSPGSCDADGGVFIFVSGIDMKWDAETNGKEVIIPFGPVKE